jgi:hypothetical protein
MPRNHVDAVRGGKLGAAKAARLRRYQRRPRALRKFTKAQLDEEWDREPLEDEVPVYVDQLAWQSQPVLDCGRRLNRRPYMDEDGGEGLAEQNRKDDEPRWDDE